MEPLSRNKKIGIFSLVVLGLTLVGLFGTGTMSLSWLKSDIFNQSEYVCTEKGQITNKGAYNKAIKSRDNTTNTINLRKSEITVLENKIATNQTLVAQKKSQIETKKSTIKDLQAYISKNCVGTLKPTVQKICNQKKQQLQKAQSDMTALTKEISFLESEMRKFEQQVATKTQNIKVLEAKREASILFITQYELCDRQLKVKPLLTSPKMSGEARMSGELLVSGEVCMSSEVIISGEVHVSGEVNAPVYRLAITEEYPGKAEINWIDFNMAFGNPDTIQITDFYVAEEGQTMPLYKCFFLDQNKTRLNCLPGKEGIVHSETRNYILYAKVKTITGVGDFKIYSANIAYNGGKIDATNRTTPIKIKYGPIVSCIKPSITVLSPNGGENWWPQKDNSIKWHGENYPTSGYINLFLQNREGASVGIIKRIFFSSNNPIQKEEYIWDTSTLSSIGIQTNGVPYPTDISNGLYKIRAAMVDTSRSWEPLTASDESDSWFNILPPCTDSDGGNNIYIQGSTKGQKWSNDNTIYSRTDTCAALEGSSAELQNCSGDNCGVREFTCMVQEYVSFVNGNMQKCPNGCSNGACIATNTTAPVITALILPSTSSTTKVPLTIKADKSPVNYLMIDGPTPKDGLVPALPPKPLANDTRWLSTAPTSYNFTGIGSRTLFAWIKDVAGNVSESRSAVVAINQCPEIMPPVCQEGEVLVPQTGTGANGCPLPPVCALPTNVCPVYPPLPDNWCRGTLLPLSKDKNGCELPPVCIL